MVALIFKQYTVVKEKELFYSGLHLGYKIKVTTDSVPMRSIACSVVWLDLEIKAFNSHSFVLFLLQLMLVLVKKKTCWMMMERSASCKCIYWYTLCNNYLLFSLPFSSTVIMLADIATVLVRSNNK